MEDCPKSTRVLVVDDEPQVRNALARVVRRAELTPVVAATAEEALALSQGDTFDVVIADVHMPGIGGLAMLQRLSPMQSSARFLVVTGTQEVPHESIPRCHRTKVFRKPWCEEELIAAILFDPNATHSSFPPAPISELGPDKVLLIEDDSGDAKLFHTALRMACPGQFEVHHALSISKAQDLASQMEFDVVALDLQLGDTRGMRTITEVQSKFPHLGLVVMSGVADPEVALRSVQAGAQDYLVKGTVGGTTIGRALRYAEERKRAELRLADMAFHDQLTGLANRTLFRQCIAQASARARRSNESFAVLLLDVDRFKSVNDAFGHDAGDVFLCQLAERLSEATRETDVVARLGGDEFAILAEPVGSEQDVEMLASRVIATLRQPLRVAGVQVLPTASIGGSRYPESGEDSDTLLAAADAAMYVVKERGRNGFSMHGTEMTEQAAQRLALESRLREAIRSEQFTLHYQPQLSLNRSLVGTEALLRWPQPDGSILAASEFVPILEDTGMIVELGTWIVSTACRQLAAWRAAGLSVHRIAINMSAKQFIEAELPKSIRNTVAAAGLQPADVELELTETSLLDDGEGTEAALRDLSASGFRIALDDFGTGYCSLAYLQRFPINRVKIDRSFVTDIASRTDRRALIGGIVQLATRLGIDVVAEGVETEEQLQVLRDEGCHQVQGYLFGPALPAPDFERFVVGQRGQATSLAAAG